jgi:TrmH family RNA methyltransferase
MITKTEIKKIHSLSKKKYRKQFEKFIIEGIHPITEAIKSATPNLKIYMTDSFAQHPKHIRFLQSLQNTKYILTTVQDSIMEKLSDAVTPPGIIATCLLPKQDSPDFFKKANWIYLDRIRDPGNLGTILRTSAWFHVTHVALSPRCIDPYNPKVVRSGMGAHFHLSIYNNMDLSTYKTHKFTIIGADQKGTPLGNTTLSGRVPWVLVLGNEADGISLKNIPLLDCAVSIPRVGKGDSLNVAIASGILLHQMTSFLKKNEET